MRASTVFLSAASIDLKEWRDVLHDAFSRGGFRVLTQDHSLRSAPGDVRRLLIECITESDCIVHLVGTGYGSDAQDPFAETPTFECSWTQFEYYYAHSERKDVIALVCTHELSKPNFMEEGNAIDIARKQRLQNEHRERVTTGNFNGTPLEGKMKRTSNETVDSIATLLKAVASAVGTLHHRLGESGKAVIAALDVMRSFHQLPPKPEGFVGRTDDFTKLRTLNPTSGALLAGLRGMGGIGKTALALMLAHEWAPRFSDAQLFLDGRGTQPNPPSTSDLLAKIIQTFLPTAKLPDDVAALKAIYQETLNGKKVLILLDNACDAAQAAPLIPPAGCALIVTSHHNFLLGRTVLFNVGRLPKLEAVALLREDYPAISDHDADELVELCDGLPLALRLAGAHLKLDANDRGGTPNVAGYLKTLKSGRLRALNDEAADANLISISETLRLSEAQLPDAERKAWRMLGIFTSSFDTRAAKVVAGADDTMLLRFVRRSLLELDDKERYKLHDLAADYARDQLNDDTRIKLHHAHVGHFIALAIEAETLYKMKGGAVRGLGLFDRGRTEIEAAYAWLAGREDENSARQLLALVNAVVHTGDLRFHPHQRITWLQAEIVAARFLSDRASEGCALNRLGIAHLALGEVRLAIKQHEQALLIDREIGDHHGECEVLRDLGIAHADLGEGGKAIECYEQALAIARRIGDQRNEAIVLGSLGNVHAFMRERRKAIDCFEKQLEIARQIDDRRGEGNALGNLGNAHRRSGDTRKAIVYYEQHLALAREIGHRRGEGVALGNLGTAHFAIGEVSAALKFHEKSAEIAHEIGDRRGEANALFHSALAFHLLNDPDQAIKFAADALDLFYATDAPAAPKVGDWLERLRDATVMLKKSQADGNAHWNSADRLWKRGNRSEAIVHATAALTIFEAIEAPNALEVRTKLAEWRNEMVG